VLRHLASIGFVHVSDYFTIPPPSYQPHRDDESGAVALFFARWKSIRMCAFHLLRRRAAAPGD